LDSSFELVSDHLVRYFEKLLFGPGRYRRARGRVMSAPVAADRLARRLHDCREIESARNQFARGASGP